MKKRVFAWIMLIGFVLLIANIAFFQIQWEISLVIYVTVALLYIFTIKRNNT